jgi:DNA-binding NtrC family response regulator
LEWIEQFGAELICCPAQPGQYGPLVKACQKNGRKIPVLVVTRTPAVSEWLDALEGGASDYFGPPFESGHIGWIIDSAAKSAPMASYVSVVH